MDVVYVLKDKIGFININYFYKSIGLQKYH